MRASALASVMVLVVMLAPAAVGARGGWRINAGKGVGPLYLGMTEQEAIRVLGEPMKSHHQPRSCLLVVLRRYGDEVDNAQTGQDSSRCPVVGLISRKPSNYRAVGLSLDYKNKGIEFNFTDITEGSAFTPRVADIIVTHPSSCSG